jgi:hypothetical protein
VLAVTDRRVIVADGDRSIDLATHRQWPRPTEPVVDRADPRGQKSCVKGTGWA